MIIIMIIIIMIIIIIKKLLLLHVMNKFSLMFIIHCIYNIQTKEVDFSLIFLV